MRALTKNEERALNTINALRAEMELVSAWAADMEAERDRLRDRVESWSRTAKSLDGHRQINLDAIDELETKVREIKAIARDNHDTRVVGGAHAALREILAVIEGSDEEGDQ